MTDTPIPPPMNRGLAHGNHGHLGIHNCEEHLTDICHPRQGCRMDIVVVIDNSGWGAPAIEDHIDRIEELKSFLEDAVQDFQISLVSVNEAAAAVEQAFTSNFADYDTALNAVTVPPQPDVFTSTRAFHLAFDLIENQTMGVWRPLSTRLVLFVGTGMPDEAEQAVADASALAANTDHQVEFHGIHNPYWQEDDRVPQWADNGYAFYLRIAGFTGGTAQQVAIDGRDSRNFRIKLISSIMRGIIDRKCDRTSIPVERNCCGISPCRFCVKWEVYGEDDRWGTMIGGTNGGILDGIYVGRVAGMSVRMYREVLGLCLFVVEVDGVVVWSAPKCSEVPDDPNEEIQVGVDCRFPTGEINFTREISYNEFESGKLTFFRETERQLAERQGTAPSPPPPCLLDFVLIFDCTYSNRHLLFDLQDEIEFFVDEIIRLTAHENRSRRFAFVAVYRETHNISQPFTDKIDQESRDDFIAAVTATVAGLQTDEPPGDLLIENDRRYSNLGVALEDAWNNLDWRTNAYRWVLTYSVNGPRYGDLSYSEADKQRFIAFRNVIRDFPDACFTGIHSQFWTDPPASPRTAHSFLNVAQLFPQVLTVVMQADGQENLNGGLNPFTVPSASFPCTNFVQECPDGDPGSCGGAHCGNCWCICDNLCITVQIDGYICQGLIPWDGEECQGRFTPRWVGTVGDCINPTHDPPCVNSYVVEITIRRAEEDFVPGITTTGGGTTTTGGGGEGEGEGEGEDNFGEDENEGGGNNNDENNDLEGDTGDDPDQNLSWTIGDCVMKVSLVGYCDEFEWERRVQCPDLDWRASELIYGTESTITVDVTCMRCGDCGIQPLLCCPDIDPPQVLTLTGTAPPNCPCWTEFPFTIEMNRETIFEPTGIDYEYWGVIQYPVNTQADGSGDCDGQFLGSEDLWVVVIFRCEANGEGFLSISVTEGNPGAWPFSGDRINGATVPPVPNRADLTGSFFTTPVTDCDIPMWVFSGNGTEQGIPPYGRCNVDQGSGDNLYTFILS